MNYSELIEKLKTVKIDLVKSHWHKSSGQGLCLNVVLEDGSACTDQIWEGDIIECVERILVLHRSMQKMETSRYKELAGLKKGQKYTLLSTNDFGGANSTQITLEEVIFTKYAQYDDAVKIVFKKKRGRNLVSRYVYGIKQISVYAGWIELDTNMYTEPRTCPKSGLTVKESKYLSCDDRYFTDALASAKSAPLFVSANMDKLLEERN